MYGADFHISPVHACEIELACSAKHVTIRPHVHLKTLKVTNSTILRFTFCIPSRTAVSSIVVITGEAEEMASGKNKYNNWISHRPGIFPLILLLYFSSFFFLGNADTQISRQLATNMDLCGRSKNMVWCPPNSRECHGKHHCQTITINRISTNQVKPGKLQHMCNTSD